MAKNRIGVARTKDIREAISATKRANFLIKYNSETYDRTKRWVLKPHIKFNLVKNKEIGFKKLYTSQRAAIKEIHISGTAFSNLTQKKTPTYKGYSVDNIKMYY
jgi:hypothetical protein